MAEFKEFKDKQFYKDFEKGLEELNILESIAINKIKNASLDLENIRKSKEELARLFLENLRADDVNVVC